MKDTTSSDGLRLHLARFSVLIPCSAAFLAGLTAQAQPSSPYATEVMSFNPAAYWPLQETTQPPPAFVETNYSTYSGGPGQLANLYWSSTSSANLVPFNSAPGASGYSTQFNGNSSAFGLVPTTTNSVSLAPGQPFTVELWVYPLETGSYQGIVDNAGPIPAGGNNAASYKAGWAFSQNYTPNEDDGNGTLSGALFGWSFAVFNGTSTYGSAEANAPYQYALNTWYHLVGVFDGVNARVYVDGVRASSDESPMPAGTSFVPDTWDPIQLGGSRGLGGNSWKGAMSDLAIYNYALSSNQVANHYAASEGNYESAVFGDNPYMFWYLNGNPNYPFGPVTIPTPASGSLWPAAGNYGTAALNFTNYDYSGVEGTNAVYQPGTVPGIPGPGYAGFGSPSYSCAFNGINGAVDAGYNAALNPTNTNNFSIVGWFKNNPADNNSRTNTLVSHSAKSWRVSIQNGNMKFNPGSGSDVTISSSTINVNDGRWHMFAGVWANTSGNTGTASLYIDGAFSNSATITTAFPGASTTNVFLGGAPDFAQTNYSLYNANYNTNYNTAQQYYAGELAHVAFFTNALTPAQVETIYSAAEAPPAIVTQPASVANVVAGGGTNTFTVTASGATTLTYQWYLTNASGLTMLANDSVHISGATSAALTITNTVTAESGSYFVVVSNAYGSATSSLANLQIASAPLITSQTGGGSIQLFTGQYYALSVTAIGDPTLTYQWYTNGVADTTAGTSSSYTLGPAQASMVGYSYYCVVGNGSGTATSATTTLSAVNNLPASLTSSAYGSAILALNPSAYWPMHEVSPGVAGDEETNIGSLGNIANGFFADWDINFSIVTNLPEIMHGQTGAIVNDPDTAVGFDRGPASYMIVPHAAPQATIKPPFTVECWARPSINSSYAVLVGQGGGVGYNGSTNLGGFALQWSGPTVTNSFSFTVFNGKGNGSATLSTTANYPVGPWYHVVATYDGTNLAIYVNGQTPTGGYANGSVSTASMNPDTWSPITVGVGRLTGSFPAQNPYGGVIDEVAIYTNVLTQSRINQHYTDGTTGAAGVYKSDVIADQALLYYRMDSPAYTVPPVSSWPVLTNYGTNAQNGAYTPGSIPGNYTNVLITGLSSTVSSPGNGMGAYANAGLFPGVNPTGYTSFSYSAFYRCYPADNSARTFQSVMSGNDATWRANINSAGKMQVHGGNGGDATSPNIYNDGNWHQFVMTAQAYNSTNYTNLLYVDGSLVFSNNPTGTNNPFSDPGPLALLGNEFGFNITNNFTGSAAGERCLAGTVCEAAFFDNQVLTAGQISNLYLVAGVTPFFTVQPVSTNLNQGQNLTLTAVGAGSGSVFNYQWYSNGVAMAGQTSTNLSFTPIVGANAASYYCVVSNSYGTGASTVAIVTVNTSPVITSSSPSSSILVLGGVPVNFSVTVTGALPLAYSWVSNGVTVAGATNSSFTMSNSTAVSSGTYSCVVTNFLGKATNNWAVTIVPTAGPFMPAVVALNPIGYWLLNEQPTNGNPANGVICHDYVSGNNGVYENTTLGVNGYNFADSGSGFYDTNTAAEFVYGGNSCAYNISNIDFSAATGGTSSFTVMAWAQGTATQTGTAPGIVAKGLFNNEEFTMDAAGNNYRFEVRNGAGTAINANTGIPASDGVWHLLTGVCDEVHGAVTLYIDGTNAGSAAIATNGGIYGPDVSVPMTIGARSSAASYSPSGMDQQFVGNIADVALFHYALTATQVTNMYLSSGIAPKITLQPPAVTNVTYGNTLTVSATASGTSPLSFQWYDTNGAVTGQTNGTLSIASDTVDDSYYLVVTNLYGKATSSIVAVTVNTTPLITSQTPQTNLTVVAGASVTFIVTVSGTSPLHYYWLSNGVSISGQTNLSYTVTNMGSSSTITFGVSNFLGTNTASWNVTVQPTSGGFMPAVMALRPSDYWLLNEPSGSTVCIDYVGGNNGVYENTTLGQPGYNFSDSFSGFYDTNTAAGFLAAQNSCAYNISNIDFTTPTNANAEFTVQAWVQATAEMPNSLNTPGIVGKGLYNNEEFALDCGVHLAVADGYRFSVRNASGAAVNANSGVVAGADNNWHFLVGVCDEANGELTLYIDGTNAAEVSLPPGSGLFGNNATIPVMIGARTSAATYSPTTMNEQFTGNMADAAIFRYALSSNQVLAEYLAAGIAPQIQLLPTNLDQDYGGTLTIASTVVGTAPLSYQWFDTNAGKLTGQTNATLVVNNDTASDSYYVVASNPYGTNTSSTTVVTVIKAPSIVQDISPSSATIVADTSLQLTVLVDGQLPLSYTWQHNGSPVSNSGRISGANSNVLTINPVLVSDAGTYQLFVSNGSGSTNSSQAVIAVAPNLTFNGNGAGWTTHTLVSSSLAWEGNDVLQLTDDVGSEASAAFYALPVNISAFQATYSYQVTTGPSGSADGTTFCIQNDPRGANAIGAAGGGLGVASSPAVTPSVELEFNIYSGNNLGGVGLSFNTNGAVGPVTSTAPVVLNSGDVINAVVTYMNGVARVALTDTSANATYTASASVNIPAVLGTNIAYVGFTGSDGGSKSTQVVSDFGFVNIVTLSAQVSGSNLVLTWPADTGGYVVEQSPSVGQPNWTPVSQTPVIVNGQNQITVPMPATDVYYQLIMANAEPGQ